jgi:chemotaxis protein MotA
MDLATIIGTISAFALVVIAIFMGGDLGMFLDVPSLLIVVGGTLGVTLINYPLRDLLKLMSVVKRVFVERLNSAPKVIHDFVELSHRARKDGILSLEPTVRAMDDRFMAKGLQMTIDGVEPTVVKETLETEIDNVIERHRVGADIFTSMGTFAPALGMIGTLIGLVQMLRTMNDPSAIGPGMAVALMTTFYGAVLANMLFLPMSGKLRNRSAEEVVMKELILQGVLGIARGDNPRVLEQKLHSFIPASMRTSSFQ